MICGHSPLTVCRARQWNHRWGLQHKVLNLDRVPHSVDIGIRSLQRSIDANSPSNTEFQACFCCQSIFRSNTDTKDDNLSRKSFPRFQPDDDPVGRLLKPVGTFAQEQIHPFRSQLFDDRSRHLMIQRWQNLLLQFHKRCRDSQVDKIFDELQANEACSDNDSLLDSTRDN